MVSSSHNDLFNESGPKGMLKYLQSRLEAGDLTSEEALAMLSAVHEELGKGGSTDRSAYEAYSHFMNNLKASMPEVHEYVLSAWNQRGVKSASSEYDDVENLEENEFESSESETNVKGSFGEVESSRAEMAEEGGAEGVEEGELEDERKNEEKMQTEESEEEKQDEEETEPEEVEEKEEEEPEEEEPEAEQEPEESAEEEKAAEEPAQESEKEQEAPEAEEGAGEAEGDAAESESEGAEHGEEMEWPQIEEPEPEEPIEGEEGEAPAVD